MQTEPRLPVIVMGRGPTALGILRSLDLAGIAAYVACPPDDLVIRSRHFQAVPGCPDWDGSPGPQAFEALADCALARAVIIAGADDAALWLAELPHTALGWRFPVSTASREVQRLLQDKSAFAGYLKAIHVPHPRTFRLTHAGDIDVIPFDTLGRVFLKPVNSQKFSDVTGVKGLWVEGADALRETWARFHAQGFRVIAQEYVPGPPSEHFFVDGFRDGQGGYAGLFARQRRRMSPPDFGNSSCSRAVPLSAVPEAVDSIRRVLDGLDYRGIFSAEFKRDPRDGACRLIEVNTRAWTYVEFAARCGVNVCAMAWADAQCLPVTRAASDYDTGGSCIDLYHDIASVRCSPAARHPGWIRLVIEWLRADLHVFRRDDPAPAWHFIQGLLRKRLGGSVRPTQRRGDVFEGASLGGDTK
ncbi:hypothetical protein [Xanthomonas sp. NCPPB 2632]|jgi:predicted ATP-grasp superfamily ATP-dependent carboligase|uniref:carboxylate--amine ligase n=1 Tax=Xanthomonas sp. NCPPB 2632 TaxID=3240912 RepID=UPI0035162BEB